MERQKQTEKIKIRIYSLPEIKILKVYLYLSVLLISCNMSSYKLTKNYETGIPNKIISESFNNYDHFKINKYLKIIFDSCRYQQLEIGQSQYFFIQVELGGDINYSYIDCDSPNIKFLNVSRIRDSTNSQEKLYLNGKKDSFYYKIESYSNPKLSNQLTKSVCKHELSWDTSSNVMKEGPISQVVFEVIRISKKHYKINIYTVSPIGMVKWTTKQSKYKPVWNNNQVKKARIKRSEKERIRFYR